MANLNDELIQWQIAKNVFQAAHIVTGLKLWELKTAEERRVRAELYRDWRKSGVFPRHDTASCYTKAIAGEDVPQLVSRADVKTDELHVTYIVHGGNPQTCRRCYASTRPPCCNCGHALSGSVEISTNQTICEFCGKTQSAISRADAEIGEAE